MKFRNTFTLMFLCLAITPSLAQNLPPEVVNYADWVFYNGVILTMDSDAPPLRTVSAVAIRGNRVLAAGDDQRILAMAGPETERVDLAGRTIMPGVIDTHSHPNRSALRDYQEDIPEAIRLSMHPLDVDFQVDDKTELMNRIRAAVEKAPASVEWLATSEPGQDEFTKAWRSLTRQDMDRISPDRPLSAIWRLFGPVNTKAIEVLTDKFGENLPGIIRDENGEPTGWIEGVAAWTVYTDMRPNVGPRWLAAVYKKELEEWVALGVTTLSTRLSGHEISGMARLARDDELPLRMAFSHDGVGRLNPLLDWYLGRMGNLQDFGYKDWIWMIGLSIGIPDAGPEGGYVASRAPKRNPLPTDTTGKDSVLFWDSPGDPSDEDILIANRYGYRVTGVHTFGDLGYESMLDQYEKALAEDNEVESDYPPFTLDHLMLVSPAVLGKMQSLTQAGSRKNLALSVQSPMFFAERSAIVRRVYGEEVFWEWLQPNASMKNAGSILTYGADTSSDPNRHPMHSLQVIVSRKNHEGTAINPAEGLSREEGLLMLTRWGSYYVGRDDLGALEAGDLADLLVLSQNPLSPNVPVDTIKDTKVLFTMINGRPAYVGPDFEY